MSKETKVINVYPKYLDNAIKRQESLGWSVISSSTSSIDMEPITTLTLQRDKDIPNYERLVEIEQNINKLDKIASEYVDKERKNIDKFKKATLPIVLLGTILSAGYILGYLLGALFLILGIAFSDLSNIIAGIITIGLGVGLMFLNKKFKKKFFSKDKSENMKEVDAIEEKIEEFYKKAKEINNDK